MKNGSSNANKQKELLFNNYVSSIKVAGISFLPPVITNERRIELHNDKQKAIEIEKRLGIQRDIQEFFKQYELADNFSANMKLCDKILDDTLLYSDISQKNALNHASSLIQDSNKNSLPSKVVPLLDANATAGEPSHRKVCDNREIDDVAELSASTVELDLTDNVTINSQSAENSSRVGCPLTRSKTFVLPAPSPFLLKHLKERPNTSPGFYSAASEVVNLSLRSNSDDRSSAEEATGRVPKLQEQIDISTFTHSTLTQWEYKDETLQPGCDFYIGSSSSSMEHIDGDKTNINDLEMPQIFFTHKMNDFTIVQHSNEEILTAESADNSFTSGIDYLNDSAYEDNNQNTIVKSNLDIYLLQNVMEGCVDISENNHSSLLDSESLVFNKNDVLSTSTPNLIDFDSDNCDIGAVTSFTQEGDTSSLAVVDAEIPMSPLDYPNIEEPLEVVTCRPDKAQRRLKEKWAATVLTAAAKGFLVRRLKRTERVQNLIQTIRDALVCALSLHAESSESIQNSDVELHRRLIQQVSAACYEFYEVFFSLSTKEKMDLIALDRQRLRDKLKRPKSGTKLKIESTKSTPKSHRQTFNARQKKQLTPTFAA